MCELCVLTLECCKNTTVGATMLCPAVCISDVTNKAGMCGKTYQVPVFRFSVVKSKSTWLHPEESKFDR